MVPPILITELDIRGQSTSLPGCFVDDERAPGTGCVGVLVGPSAGRDILENRKICYGYVEANSGSSVVQPRQ